MLGVLKEPSGFWIVLNAVKAFMKQMNLSLLCDSQEEVLQL